MPDDTAREQLAVTISGHKLDISSGPPSSASWINDTILRHLRATGAAMMPRDSDEPHPHPHSLPSPYDSPTVAASPTVSTATPGICLSSGAPPGGERLVGGGVGGGETNNRDRDRKRKGHDESDGTAAGERGKGGKGRGRGRES